MRYILSIDFNNRAFGRQFVDVVKANTTISPDYYSTYDLKHGLRNDDGTGVLVGVSGIASVSGYKMLDDKIIPTEGELRYRGIRLTDLVENYFKEDKFGYEETIYLLLSGSLPTKGEMAAFDELLEENRKLPDSFIENFIINSPSQNVMNNMQRVLLALYSFDDKAEDRDFENQISQVISIIAKMPLILAYSYIGKKYYYDDASLILHHLEPNMSTAETILHLIRPDATFTDEEAKLLDLCLIIHAEHGGGNNSTFATHVVSSTGTDTYSTISTALSSLKGSKHGGANSMVEAMVQDLKATTADWTDKDQVEKYLRDILNKQAFDQSGLIYGMGHAVYTKSDPRAVLLKDKAKEMAIEKGYCDDFNLLSNIEAITKDLINEKRPGSEICANVDLYTGLVYRMLGLSPDLYTPIFAVARTAGWCAHRLEQIQDPKIIRPAYVNISENKAYLAMEDRQSKHSQLAIK